MWQRKIEVGTLYSTRMHSFNPFLSIHVLFYQGNVELWLNTLLKESRSSLHSVIRMASIAIRDSGFKLKDFLDTYPAQVNLPKGYGL